MSELRVVSQSEISTWQGCKRKWYLNHIRRLTKIWNRPDALTQGTYFHLGFEFRYEGNGVWRDMIDQAIRQDMEVMDPIDHPKLIKQHELAVIMMEGLIEWAAEEGLDVGVEVLGSEIPIQADFGFYSIRGKLDELIKVNELVGYRDAKSAGDGFKLIDHAQLDRQFRIYRMIMDAMPEYADMAPGFGEWVIARKVKRGKTAKPPFYKAHKTYFNEHTMAALRMQIDTIMRDMIHRIEQWETGKYHMDQLFPPNPDKMACGWCKYRDVCPMFDNGSDVEAYLEEFYEVYDPNARYEELDTP